MITIYINSNPVALPETVTLKEALNEHGYTKGHFAIAVNRQFIPRAQYVTTQLNEGDQIDVVTPMQGG